MQILTLKKHIFKHFVRKRSFLAQYVPFIGQILYFSHSRSHFASQSLTLVPPLFFFVLKTLSALYVCCKYSNAFRLNFLMEANTMNPDQTAPWEQSDLGPYCLQYRLPKT